MFEVTERSGILRLRLDTPGCAVNIFNHAAAEQLTRLLGAELPSSVRAVLIESGKPGSFINGVGLMLAQSAKTLPTYRAHSRDIRAAYDAVESCRVPTFAAVRGSCFGCGVEFSLRCGRRAAWPETSTVFYMTELEDYLFLPLFGGTWHLPRLLGLSAAIDFLLWGQRWEAERARELGLVDELLEDDDEAGLRWVERELAQGVPERRWQGGESEPAEVARARDRIAALPPDQQRVYEAGLELLHGAWRGRWSYEDHLEEELVRSAESVAAPMVKQSMAFFFIRQMALGRARGRRSEGPLRLALEASGDELWQAFAERCRGWRLAGLELVEDDADLLLRPAGAPATGRGRRELEVSFSVAARPVGEGGLLALPEFAAGGRYAELASLEEELDGFARVLIKAGFMVVRSRPSEGQALLGEALVGATYEPLLRALAEGVGAGELVEELRLFGFRRGPAERLVGLGSGAVAELIKRRGFEAGGDGAALLDALAGAERAEQGVDWLVESLLVSWLAQVEGVLERGLVEHAAVIDLAARELLGFPLSRCSLCRSLRRERVELSLARLAGARRGSSEGERRVAMAFVSGPREFYR